MRIYITHCSAKKNLQCRVDNSSVRPDVLYTSKKTQDFIRECRRQSATWAIFSDQYGVWFPEEQHTWYEKHPNRVTLWEFRKLLDDFDTKLALFEEIYFYRNPGRFHPLYKRLLDESKLKDRIKLISSIREIR